MSTHSFESREFLAQPANPTDGARNALRELLRVVENSKQFGDYYTKKAGEMFGKFDQLSPETQQAIAPGLEKYASTASATDNAIRSQTQREFAMKAQGDYDRRSAARHLDDEFAFVG